MNLTAPYSQQAEESVLGACLVDPDSFGLVASILSISDYYILRHTYIHEALDRLYKRGDSIDFVTVSDELRTINRLNDVGGPAYLLHLINSTPTSVHAEVYAHMVERTAQRRRYLVLADEIKALALDESLSTEKVTESIDQRWLNTQRGSDRQVVPVRTALQRHSERIEALAKNPKHVLGISSSLDELNKILHGYQSGKLYIAAGRPSMGKSTFLLTEAAHSAGNGSRVLFASLEMPEEEVVDNLVSLTARIPIERIQNGMMDKDQFSQHDATVTKMQDWSLTICDQASLTPLELRSMARKLQITRGLDMVYVDYVQLMSGGREQKYDNRDQEIGYISRSLKAIAKDLRIPVVCAAQLSRDVEKRADKHPKLSDLRESGNLEQDADVVMFFYRQDYYVKPIAPPVVSATDITISKHRGGRLGTVKAGLHGEIKRIVPVIREEAAS